MSRRKDKKKKREKELKKHSNMKRNGTVIRSPNKVSVRKLSLEEARQSGWGTAEEVANGKAINILAKVV